MKIITLTFIISLLLSIKASAQQTDSITAVRDSILDINLPEYKEKANPDKIGKIAGIAIPSTMVLYGLLSLNIDGIRDIDYNTKDYLVKHDAIISTKLDNVGLFLPAGAAFGMKLCKVDNKHSLVDMTLIYGLSNTLNLGVVETTKYTTKRMRPDGSDTKSFPSGHTSSAFVAAEFLHQEYGHKSIWISIGGYSCATIIGAGRIIQNRHWVSDVVAGAGIGILSTKMAYWLYPYINDFLCKNVTCFSKYTNYALLFPSYNQDGLSLNFSYSF